MFENYLQAFGAAKKNTKFENRSSISEINILEFNKKYVLLLKCSADSIDPIMFIYFSGSRTIFSNNRLPLFVDCAHCRSSVLFPCASSFFHHTCSFIKILYLFACTNKWKGPEKLNWLSVIHHIYFFFFLGSNLSLPFPTHTGRVCFDLELWHTAEPTEISWLFGALCPATLFKYSLRWQNFGVLVCAHLSDFFGFYYVLFWVVYGWRLFVATNVTRPSLKIFTILPPKILTLLWQQVCRRPKLESCHGKTWAFISRLNFPPSQSFRLKSLQSLICAKFVIDGFPCRA